MKNELFKKFKSGKRNFFDSIRDALNGILYCLISEKNMKFHFVAAILVFCLGIYLKLSKIEFAIIFLTVLSVIGFELMNTAIENTVDLITEKYNEKAKVIKDVSAGAVLISAFASILIGIAIFVPKLIEV